MDELLASADTNECIFLHGKSKTDKLFDIVAVVGYNRHGLFLQRDNIYQ